MIEKCEIALPVAGIQKQTVQDSRLRADLSKNRLDRQMMSGAAEPFWDSSPLRVEDSLNRYESFAWDQMS